MVADWYILEIEVEKVYYRARIIDVGSINDQVVHKCYGVLDFAEF